MTAPRPTLRDIVAATAEVTGVNEAILRGGQRRRSAARARQAGYWAAVEEGYSYPKIGDAFGGRDHTTIIYGRRRADGSPEILGAAKKVLDTARRIATRRRVWKIDVPPVVVRIERPPLPAIPLPTLPQQQRKAVAIPPTLVISKEDRRTPRHIAGHAANEHRW